MSPRRTVALFRNNFLPYSQTFIHDQIRHHGRYQVVVFARKWRNRDLFPGHNVVCIEMHPGKKHYLESHLYKHFHRSATFDRAFKEHSFDIIHAHFAYDGVYAVHFARKFNIPLVVTLYGHDVTILMGREKFRPKYWSYWRNKDELFEAVSLFLACSSELRESMIALGCPQEKLQVHHLGIDLSQFSPGELKAHKPHQVVMMGRFIEKKGFIHGLEAFARMVEKGIDAELNMVGEGPLLDSYKKLIEETGLGDKVHFPGVIDYGQINDLFREASVVLAPSVVAHNLDREGLPMVIMEASACGVPVIGSIHADIPAAIDHGETGFLVPERDVEGLAESLTTILTDEDLRRQMGKNARLKAEKQFDIRMRNKKLEEIYDSLALP